MPAPTNTSALTAIAIPSLPYNVTQQVNDGGTTYTVWYSYTAVVGDVEIGIFGFGDLAVYRPSARAFTGPPGAPTPYIGGGVATNVAMQIPVLPGMTYYFSFTPNVGNPTPSILTLSVLLGPHLGIPGAALLINDDTDGFPAAILDASTGLATWFLFPFVAGEAGDILADGTMLFADAWNGVLQMYSGSFGSFAKGLTIGDNIGFSTALRAQQTLNRFYAGKDHNPPVVTVYSAAGALLETHTLTGHTGIHGIAANNAGTILYHSRGNQTGDPIARWDLGGDANLSDLAASTANQLVEDILVLADDSIVASYINISVSPAEVHARHYSSAGALLQTYATVTTLLPGGTVPRLAYGADASSFWMWHHPDVGVSRFREIRVADGAILTSVDSVEYEGGIYGQAETATPVARFGNSFSCPFVLLRSTGLSGGVGGTSGGAGEMGGFGGTIGTPGGGDGPLPSPCVCPNPDPVGGPVCLAPILGGGA